MPLTLFRLRPGARRRGGGDGDEPPGRDGAAHRRRRAGRGAHHHRPARAPRGPGQHRGRGRRPRASSSPALSRAAIAVVNLDDPHVVAAGRARPGAAARLRAGRRGRRAAGGGDAARASAAWRWSSRPPGAAGRCRSASSASTTRSTPTGAFALATALGYRPEECVAGLEAARPYARRLNVLEAAGGVTVVDDCYNANPASMAAALRDRAGRSPPAGGRWRCWATCWSSGPGEQDDHLALGAQVSQVAALAAFFGPRSAWTAGGGAGHRVGTLPGGGAALGLAPAAAAARGPRPGEGEPRHASRAGGGRTDRSGRFRGTLRPHSRPCSSSSTDCSGTPRRSGSSTSSATPRSASWPRASRRCCIGLFWGRALHRAAAPQPARAEQRPRGHARPPPEEEGHADDGRHAHPGLHRRRDAALRRPRQRAWCGWRCSGPSATASSASSTTGSSSPSGTARGSPGRRSSCCRRCSTWSASSASSAPGRAGCRTSSSTPASPCPSSPPGTSTPTWAGSTCSSAGWWWWAPRTR